MIRLIKRYGGTSRKLYDTEESRYVSLEDLSAWIREGQELKVVDSQGGEDVTAQTLTQSIYEDHRRGQRPAFRGIPAPDHPPGQPGLHRRIARSRRRWTPGPPFPGEPGLHRGTKADLELLRKRLAELEATLADFQTGTKAGNGAGRPRASRKNNS